MIMWIKKQFWKYMLHSFVKRANKQSDWHGFTLSVRTGFSKEMNSEVLYTDHSGHKPGEYYVAYGSGYVWDDDRNQKGGATLTFDDYRYQYCCLIKSCIV